MEEMRHLIEDLEWRTHGGLNVENLNVLPVLLQERDQEVDGKLNVEGDFSRSHGDVGDGQGHAHNLLHLELDGGLGSLDLLLEVVILITFFFKAQTSSKLVFFFIKK